MRVLYLLTAISLLSLCTQPVFSQCSSCTYNVTSNSNASHNLNSGQTLCIKPGVTFTGDINLSGGTLCNSGTIAGGNLNFNSGKVYNYGNIKRSGITIQGEFHNYGKLEILNDLNINSPSGQFYNEVGATLIVNGNINNNKGFKNEGTVTVNGSYQANGGSSFNINSGDMVIKGDLNLNALFANSGPLKVEGNVAVNGGATLTNALNTTIIVSGNYHNNGNTLNDGAIEVGKTFTNNGGGNYINNENTTIYGNFMNNGSIDGDPNSCNAFLVGGTSVVQNSGGSITNNDFCASMFPGNNFSLNTGSTLGATFCSCSQVNPLPVELTSFTAACAGTGVEVSWTTASEINNAFFTISRSADATNWETVTVVTGAGSSNAPLAYSITDNRASSDVSYYRIQQTDYDGSTEYFDPVSVNCDPKFHAGNVSVYPNPADGQFTVSVFAAQADPDARLEILDIAGKRVNVRNWPIPAGQNTVSVERNGLASGTYFIHVVSSAGEFAMQRVILR